MTQSLLRSLTIIVLAAMTITPGAGSARAFGQSTSRVPAVSTETVEGFAEAAMTVGLASAESGIVMRMLVREGDRVVAGDPIAVLDDDLHRALLAIAEHQASSQGRMEAARAERDMYQRRFEKLAALRSLGQAHQEELSRAQADLSISEGRLKAEQEQQMLLQLELAKAKAQLARRTVHASINATVIKIHKHPGEYVSPAAPEIATLVQLDSLRAVFLVPRGYATRLAVNQEVELRFPVIQHTCPGLVEYVSDVIDAESGTVTVKVRIDNRSGELRGGERCLLDIR